ncbi:MAG TPA: aspartate--tRNA ligase [Chloroflexota bacterium]|nr:aspartate--tRNA ligase [Chloroflexota bacterium]
MKRSMMCGEVRAEHIGQTVVLQGWVHTVRDHGGLIFVDLRDRAGLVQVIVNPATNQQAFEVASGLHDEYVVEIRGQVERRPAGSENPRIPSGEIEVHASDVTVLNACLPLPFPVAEEAQVDERVRLQYRYIDLRRPRMARNLVLRHKVVKYIRDFLSDRGFLEMETPILANPTPEGARDYLVPSRLHPGSFYALPQSPQQFKQLSMVAGVDRYYQIARCFRDEDLRANRQPEFTQLDLEMSFVEQEDVLGVCEELFSGLTESLSAKRVLSKPWRRIKWQEAMDRYGSDKPDLRYELPIVDVSDIVSSSPFQVFSGAVERGGVVRGIRAPGAGSFSRRQIDELTDLVKASGARGLAWAALGPEVRSSFAKNLGEGEAEGLWQRLEATDGDLVLLVADSLDVARSSLGALRRELAKRLDLIPADVMAWAFVVEFPWFEKDETSGKLTFMHHPFTMPFDEDLPLLDTDPVKVRAKAYDVVANGEELASGSIRIHRSDIQTRMFELLGYSPERIQANFGHILKAFQYGAPPHGGIAPGIDRVVSMLADEDSIREVIPFPKNQSAQDLMMGAPTRVPQEQLKDLHIRVVEEPAPVAAGD